jgi:tRNA threonylcarbamoyladenosine biosynthesis protein TsaE
MVLLTSKSPEETLRLGEAFAAKAPPGLVIGLVGELGAGKTQWVRGFAKGLGIAERVHSPTFTLVNEYRSGRIPCYHLDLYRLDTPEQILGAGLEEYFSPQEAITVIEWFDRAQNQIVTASRIVVVHISSKIETERLIRYEGPGT